MESVNKRKHAESKDQNIENDMETGVFLGCKVGNKGFDQSQPLKLPTRVNSHRVLLLGVGVLVIGVL